MQRLLGALGPRYPGDASSWQLAAEVLACFPPRSASSDAVAEVGAGRRRSVVGALWLRLFLFLFLWLHVCKVSSVFRMDPIPNQILAPAVDHGTLRCV